MTDAASPRFLHVANGTSVTMTLEVAGVPGAYSIWADPLHDGPVPAGLDDRELVAVRMRYLASGPGTTATAWTGTDPSVDPINDLNEWRAAIARHESYDELVLWFEHDLFDQLNLIQLLTWIRKHVPVTKPVSLVCIGSFPGRPHFRGLGELTADELAPLLDTRQPVHDREYELARRAWQAFREPTPEALDELRQADTSPLPYLAPALTRFLQEYPWTADGLSRTERHLLKLANGDGVSLREAFPRMYENESVYHITGESLTDVAQALSRTAPPLLTLELSSTTERSNLRGVVRVTDTGRSVLSRREDRVAACGIDRWLGGVHLHDGSRIWRWDDARQRVA